MSERMRLREDDMEPGFYCTECRRRVPRDERADCRTEDGKTVSICGRCACDWEYERCLNCGLWVPRDTGRWLGRDFYYCILCCGEAVVGWMALHERAEGAERECERLAAGLRDQDTVRMAAIYRCLNIEGPARRLIHLLQDTVRGSEEPVGIDLACSSPALAQELASALAELEAALSANAADGLREQWKETAGE